MGFLSSIKKMFDKQPEEANANSINVRNNEVAEYTGLQMSKKEKEIVAVICSAGAAKNYKDSEFTIKKIIKTK